MAHHAERYVAHRRDLRFRRGPHEQRLYWREFVLLTSHHGYPHREIQPVDEFRRLQDSGRGVRAARLERRGTAKDRRVASSLRI